MFLYKHKPIGLETISKTQQFGNLHDGWAAFQIMEIKSSTSKAGNPMVEIISQCVNEDGSTGKVWDRVPLIESWEWKIGAYYKTCGLYELYNKEEINIEHLINAKGAFILGWEEWDGQKNLKPNEFTGKEKLRPKEFVYPDKQLTFAEIKEDFKFDDDIPF